MATPLMRADGWSACVPLACDVRGEQLGIAAFAGAAPSFRSLPERPHIAVSTRGMGPVSPAIAKEKARIGNIDGAVQTAHSAVDFCFDSGDMTGRGPAVATLVELLLRRGRQGDLIEAGTAIERLAAVPVDPGFVLHELPLLRMRALLARAHGDEAGYRTFADRYRNMANAFGFEGHIATAATMT